MIPTGDTQLLGLIGSNIQRSYSFQLHNGCIQHQQRNAIYVPLQGTHMDWSTLFSIDNFLGANVTMPHKERLLDDMNTLSERASTIGAINTIYKKDGTLIGDNTDAIGFLSSLKDFDIPWCERPIYLLGAGGAAKAICVALSTVGVSKVNVWNRNVKRIQSLLRCINTVEYWDRNTLLPNNAIVVQCTSLGQHGEDPLHEQSLHADQIVLDLIYRDTILINRARAVGALAINGLGMLIHQAAHSFSLWFDCPPPIELMTKQFHNLQQSETAP